MESRERNAEKELKDLLDKLFATVRVFQAGDQEVTDGNDLADRLNRAGKYFVIPFYSQFDVADSDKWDEVLDEARKGSLEALKAVGHHQEANTNAVCQKLLAHIGPGKKGAEIRDNFEGPPFGWPRDTIDGALFALLAAGHICATDAASKAVDSKSIDRNKLTQASFRQESITISPPQFIKIRQLFSAVGVPCQPKNELAKAPLLNAKLRELASKAGGQAPAPEVPKRAAIEALEAQSGNARLLELFNRYDELPTLAKQWLKTADDIKKRLPVWSELVSLVQHAKELGPYAELKADADAVRANRNLVAHPDPVRPLPERAYDVLRLALNNKLQGLQNTLAHQQAQLAADSDWAKLSTAQIPSKPSATRPNRQHAPHWRNWPWRTPRHPTI